MQDEFLCFGKKWQRTVNVMWITSPTQCEHKVWPLQSTEPSSSGSRWAPWWGFCISVTLPFRSPSCTQLNLSNRAMDYVTAPERSKARLPQWSQPYNYRSHELWLNFVVPFSLKLSTPLCQPASHFKLHPKTLSVHFMWLADKSIYLCSFPCTCLFSSVLIFSTS